MQTLLVALAGRQALLCSCWGAEGTSSYWKAADDAASHATTKFPLCLWEPFHINHREAQQSCRSSSASPGSRRELQPPRSTAPPAEEHWSTPGGIFSRRSKPCFPMDFLSYKHPPVRLQRQRCRLLLAQTNQRVKESSHSAVEISQQDAKEKGGSKIQVSYIMGIIKNSWHQCLHSCCAWHRTSGLPSGTQPDLPNKKAT